MPERVPKTVPAQLFLVSDPAPEPDVADPLLDLHTNLAAVRILLERRGHSGLQEETAMNGVVAKNLAHTAPTRFVSPGTSALTIRRRDAPLEAVSSKSGEFRLLHTHARSELTEMFLHQDARLALTPAGEIIETFYLLSGKLGGEFAGNAYVLEPGDAVLTENLPEPFFLTALTDVKILYLTEKPQFHTISEHLSQLKHLAIEVELKDGYTAGHCERLQELSYRTGLKLGLSSTDLYHLYFGAYLHDVGKIRVPLTILNKPGKLTSDEWDVIKKHAEYGRELLENTFMTRSGKIVEQHHERLDGSGYPFGLRGDEISIEAAVVAVADTFDAMTTDRPYRKAMDATSALDEIWRYAGVHYRRDVVSAFTSIIKAEFLPGAEQSF